MLSIATSWQLCSISQLLNSSNPLRSVENSFIMGSGSSSIPPLSIHAKRISLLTSSPQHPSNKLRIVPPSLENIAGLMYFCEMNYITRAIPLFKETRGRHVTVLQSTSNHDHSRSQGINRCSVLSRNYRIAQDEPVSYLTVKYVFMSDHSQSSISVTRHSLFIAPTPPSY